VVVSTMPCTAKKFEAARDEFKVNGNPDVDLVLTTQELARMIQDAGIQFPELPVDSLDQPFGTKTGAGVIFANSGGVTEAVIRYAAGRLGEEHPVIEEVRAEKNRREFTASTPLGDIKMAVVHGLAKAKELVQEIKAGKSDVEFVEIMACPGGCIGGAGQPVTHSAQTRRRRAQVIRDVDTTHDVHCSQQNHVIKELYKEQLGEPNGPEAHRLLHTHYHSRKRIEGAGIVLSEFTGEAKIPVSVCIGTACHLRGAQDLLKQVLKHVDDADLNEHFDIKATFCMENCDRGPSVRVNGHMLRRATFEMVRDTLASAAAGALPAVEACDECAHA
ncbi:MAG: [Fe-Fe] hydrogenase large subunit C-terminal domain-containing protein, partial [Holophaga sp.]|nr:[Fe-Fe] hydrogenase large subunit C-terminal domain-containing protein [Holophaga sp.]